MGKIVHFQSCKWTVPFLKSDVHEIGVVHIEALNMCRCAAFVSPLPFQINESSASARRALKGSLVRTGILSHRPVL